MMFDRYRRARPAALPLPPLLLAGFAMVASGAAANSEVLRLLTEVTRGIVTPVFLLSLLALGVILSIVILIGGIGLDDVGMDRDYVGRGVGVTVMIWAAAQVVGVLPRVVANRPVLLDREFEFGSRLDLVGRFLESLGNATLEEVVLRGFLLVQLYLLFHGGAGPERRGVASAVAITLVVTALVALPGALPYPSWRSALIHQGTLLGVGLFLSWIYFRTRNLFFIIGVHTLLLAPTPIVAAPRHGEELYHAAVIGTLATVWALLWPRRN